MAEFIEVSKFKERLRQQITYTLKSGLNADAFGDKEGVLKAKWAIKAYDIAICVAENIGRDWEIVKVVRCANCRHRGCGVNRDECWCFKRETVVPWDGYCHEGERKYQEENQ